MVMTPTVGRNELARQTWQATGTIAAWCGVVSRHGLSVGLRDNA